MDTSSFLSSWAVSPIEFVFGWVKAPFDYLSSKI